MSAWPAIHPSGYASPARRSSRSRSPRRREGVYPVADPAVTYWDEYEHRKAWDEYYERRGRPRSRSPAAEEASRKRRRSASPPERNRFDPRPRYDDDYDAHSRAYGYASPRRGSQHAYPYAAPTASRAGRPPQDPYTMEPNPATLRQFAEWFRCNYPAEAKREDDADRLAEKEAGKKTRDGIRARWEKYKKQHSANQLQTLFDHHKKSPWFSEKYNPAQEWSNLRSRVRKQGWSGRPEQFLTDLDAGKYDPTSESESVKEAPAPAAPAAGDEITAKPVANPDDMEEDDGVGSPAKSETNGKFPSHGRPPRDDDVFVAPEGNQVAIRTIPPDIGRQKIEEACRSVPGFIYLALGDPLQKRHYYRAGWLRFQDDADIQNAVTRVGERKIEGFKLHVTHLIRPYAARPRQAPEIASTPRRIEKDLHQIRQLAAMLEDEYAVLQRATDGAPEPKMEDKRANGRDPEQGDVPMADGSVSARGSEQPEAEAVPEPLEKGSDAVQRRVEKLVAESLGQQDVAVGDGLDTELEAKKSVIALDLYLAYLRVAFNTCYYCAAVCDHVEELHRKCPKHVRKPLLEKTNPPAANEAGEEKEDDEKVREKTKEKERDPRERGDRRWERNDERWVEWVDSKLALLINRAGIDPTEYGGKNFDEELQKALEPHIKQEDEGKFRCRTCSKLFKASEFVEKHVANKHPELVRQLDELPFFNNFALDPHRIQPFAHLPPPLGNSNVPPPQAYGLQGTAGPYNSLDYSRSMQGYYGAYPQQQQSYHPYAGDYFQHPQPYWAPPPRRDEPAGARRLQERVGGYAPASSLVLTGVEGLPAKPVATFEPGPGARRARAASGPPPPPPPPPPDAKEDPRATAGKKVSYHDMDDVAEGDVELTY